MKRGLARLICSGGLPALLGAGFHAVAAESPLPGTLLTNAAQVQALGSTHAEQMRLPVKLRAVSLGASRYELSFSAQDETGPLLVYVKSAEDRVPFGTLVEVTGHTGGGRVFTEEIAFVRADAVEALQRGVSPEPLRLSVEAAARFEQYRLWVAVEGVLLQTCYEDGELVVHLAGDEGWVIGRIRNWPRSFLPADWQGGRVRFEGVNLGYDRKPTQAIAGQSANHLQPLTPGSANPFDAPLTNAAGLRATRSTADRWRLRATVLHADAGGIVYLRDGDTGFTSDPLYPFHAGSFKDGRYLPALPVPKLRAGDLVELVGSPLVQGGRLRMRYTQTRVLQPGELPDAVPAALAGIAAGRHLDDLVRVRGRLLERGELPRHAGQAIEWLRLEADGTRVDALLTSQGPARLGALAPDDLVETAGLVVPSEVQGRFQLRVPTAGDVRSLGLAPEAARTRAWRTAALGAALVLSAGGWIAFLRHRVSRQRREAAVIREHNATLEQRVSERTRELETAREELARSLAHERELNELKSRFVSMVSHEFRTPLGITMSAIELLRNHLDILDRTKRAELFEDIFSSTRQMAGLMEQVLLLGRVEAGRLAFRPAPLDLATLCGRLVDESLSATHRRCPIEIQVQDRLAQGSGDESLLRHVFLNLLSNAVKYSPAGAPVEFTLRRDGANAAVTVRDRGIGIPEADLPKLFQAFHRADNVGDTPGTGLGLVIVKRCVDLHGGSIEVQSKTGKGTTITVRLPLFAT